MPTLQKKYATFALSIRIFPIHSPRMHIHILSPSGAIDAALIDQATAVLRSWDWQVTEGQHARSRHGRFAGTTTERLDDLTQALAAADIDAILCARGGYGLQQIIDALSVKTNQLPLLVGFSDITVLHQWYAIHHLPSLHASMCKGLAEQRDTDLWKNAVIGNALHYNLLPHPLNRQGDIQSVMIGGNLSVLYGLQDTPYSLHRVIDSLPSVSPILFIEDIAERHYHIDRMLHNLRMSGIMERIGGLVAQAVQDYDFPVLFGMPSGHDESNYPLRLGSACRLQVDETGATLHFAAH